MRHCVLPDRRPRNTPLLDLTPLPKSALAHKARTALPLSRVAPSHAHRPASAQPFEALYKFEHFNPIQTQLFHTLYHTDRNVLLGAPTGSGKTLVAELTLMRLVRTQPGAKAVYIAPLKVRPARVRHRCSLPDPLSCLGRFAAWGAGARGGLGGREVSLRALWSACPPFPPPLPGTL